MLLQSERASEIFPWNDLAAKYLLPQKKRREGSGYQGVLGKKTSRAYYKHVHPWGLMMKSKSFLDPTSEIYKTFRRRFRLPPPLFKQFVKLCENFNIFDSIYEGKIPIEMKILSSLRILGRDNVLDDMVEFAHYSKTAIQKAFTDFTNNVALRLFPHYVKYPEGAEMKKMMETFASLGFPGCVGSVDCTHVRWDQCPALYRNLMKGKEGYPTVAFEVICDHQRKILHCSSSFFGTTNDAVLCYQDDVVEDILKGKFSEERNLSFTTTTTCGLKIKWDGCYLLADQGYPSTFGIVDPIGIPLTRDQTLFSEWIESVRKDVECVFGILKSRFRFLRNAVRYHDKKTIENVFKTCCVLHNMLLEFDVNGKGLDWDDVVDREDEDDEFILDALEEDDEDDDFVEDELDNADDVNFIQREEVEVESADESMDEINNDLFSSNEIAADSNLTSASRRGISSPALANVEVVMKWKASNYHFFKEKLQEHFSHQFALGNVTWVRKKRNGSESNVMQYVKRRVEERYRSYLLVKESSLLGYNKITKVYDKDIGQGLFARISIPEGVEIVRFEGEFITSNEVVTRQSLELAGYIIHFNANYSLDCRARCQGGACYASKANDYRKCRFKKSGLIPSSNAKLQINYISKFAYLKSTRTIQPGEEILYKYSTNYFDD